MADERSRHMHASAQIQFLQTQILIDRTKRAENGEFSKKKIMMKIKNYIFEATNYHNFREKYLNEEYTKK